MPKRENETGENSGSSTFNRVEQLMKGRRENGTNGKIPENFRLFRYRSNCYDLIVLPLSARHKIAETPEAPFYPEDKESKDGH